MGALPLEATVLDLRMPYVDGFGVLDTLRPMIPVGSYLPVLMLTADVTLEARQQALSSGAKDFLTKPFDPTEILLRINNLLETRALHVELEERVRANSKAHISKPSSALPWRWSFGRTVPVSTQSALGKRRRYLLDRSDCLATTSY